MQLSNLVFFVMVVAVFWFLVIRPQQQRAKQQAAMIAALKPGDEIVTVGGIYGVVVDVNGRVRVRVADGSEFEVAKQAVAQLVDAGELLGSEPEAGVAEPPHVAEPRIAEPEAAGAPEDEREGTS